MAVESASEKSPSMKAGIFLKGLAARNCGSSLVVGLMERCCSGMFFSAANTSTLRTNGETVTPISSMTSPRCLARQSRQISDAAEELLQGVEQRETVGAQRRIRIHHHHLV